MLANSLQANIRLAHTAERNTPGLWRVQPQQQLHQGAFTAAAGADNRHFLAGGNAQVKCVQYPFFAVAEAQVTDIDADGFTPGKRINPTRIVRFILTRQQLVDACHRAVRRVKSVLQVQQLFDRADHEPEVTEYRQHLPDRQVREQHRQHGGRAENIDTELEQQPAGAVRGVGFPLRVGGKIPDFTGTLL